MFTSVDMNPPRTSAVKFPNPNRIKKRTNVRAGKFVRRHNAQISHRPIGHVARVASTVQEHGPRHQAEAYLCAALWRASESMKEDCLMIRGFQARILRRRASGDPGDPALRRSGSPLQ